MDTAPRDGSSVRLWIASEPEPLTAHWSAQLQGWLEDDDPHRVVLHQVTGWAPRASRPAQPAATPQARRARRRPRNSDRGE